MFSRPDRPARPPLGTVRPCRVVAVYRDTALTTIFCEAAGMTYPGLKVRYGCLAAPDAAVPAVGDVGVLTLVRGRGGVEVWEFSPAGQGVPHA